MAASAVSSATETRPRGLLLDIGGVVLRGGGALSRLLSTVEPDLRPAVERIGIATDRDWLWQRMRRREVTEREYWARRAADLGAELGQTWDAHTMFSRLGDAETGYVNDCVIALIVDAKAAGIAVCALTNDLVDFHGRPWVERQDWLALFDSVIDASVTGVLKPDPRAYAAAARVLRLPPERIVYLDDMPCNVEGGRLAGFHAIEVTYAEPDAAVAEARSLLALAA